MAQDQTWAEEWAQINARMKEVLLLKTTAATWLTNRDTLEQALEGVYLQEKLNSISADQAALSGLLSPDNLKRAWTPHLLELARIAGIPERDPAQIVVKLREEYMVTNAMFILSRGLSFGSMAANTGTGNFVNNRLTVDAQGQILENVFTEAKKAIIVADQGQVDEHEELLEYRGVEAEPDFLSLQGSGMIQRVPLISAGTRFSQRFVQNPSFSDFTGTAPTAGVPSTPASTTELTGWVITTVGNARVLLDTPTPYRGFPGDTTPYALRFTADNKIVQTLQDTIRPRFERGVPIYVQFAVYRESSCDGNLILRFGAITITIAMSTFTNSTWEIYRLTIGTNNWYENFKKDGFTVELELSGRSTGAVVLDDLIVAPFYNIDGTWYAPVGGSTSALYGCYTTWTDALAGSEAVYQYLLFRSGLGYLRATAVATQVSASAAPTLQFANVGSSDTITRSTGSFVTDGYKVGMLVTIAGTSSNNMTTGPIVTVAATVLTFGATTALTNEGPLNATATLNATPPLLDPT
jgi:hypothetical protein